MELTKRHKSIIHAVFIMLLILQNSAYGKQKSPRIQLNMNTDWAFYRGDIEGGELPELHVTDWMPATLPHIMQLEKKHCGGNSIYDGVGWYRRYFHLPEKYRGKRIAVSFEGVMNACELFVNGKKVTEHRGGYVGFTSDISDLIRWNDNNMIALRVSAEHDALTPPGKPQDRLDFYYYSGIYRDVHMIITDKLHITDELEADKVAGGGLFVTYPKVSKEEAVIDVRTHLMNGRTAACAGILHVRLRDGKGKVVAEQMSDFSVNSGDNCELKQELTVGNPDLWHPYHPTLYDLESRIVVDNKVVDSRTEKIGIRTIRYDRDQGFFINGEHLYLLGANRHQSFPYVGDAASNSMQERDVIDMKCGGYNAVRAAHYPQDPAFLAACDKYGLLVIECIPGWQYFNDDPTFSERLYQMEREMIRRDRNHPSVILWETALNETYYPLEVVKKIYGIAHDEYPGNQMYTSADYYGHEETEPYYDVFYKQVGRSRKDGNVMSNHLEDLVAVKALFTREWGDGVGEKPRVRLDEDEVEQLRQCRGRFQQLTGKGYFDWCMLDANPRMGGHFLWSYNDYNRGAEEETMFCGVVDVNRYPKFSYYMMQSMRPKEVSQPGLYQGPMVFVASFNSSGNYITSTTDIPVFSNCDEVRLYRNGQLIGRQTREGQKKEYGAIIEKGGSPLYLFNAGGYEQGELKAEGVVNGKVVVTHSVRTPEKPHQVRIVVPSHQVRPVADGSDMIPVYFIVCDANGTRINDSKAEITIDVSGEGTLIGDKIRRIGINPQCVEGGVGFAFVRTSKKAGNIRISVSSEGLEGSEADVKSLPFDGDLLPDGHHEPFGGNEEDGVVIKPTRWDRYLLEKPRADIQTVTATSTQEGYPADHLMDGDDFSWWIAGEDAFPQVVTFTLERPTEIVGSRIRFQKDSSSYKHRVETSDDGVEWNLLYERECTGWDFKPVAMKRTIKYFRIVIERSSEGRAGLAEVTLYKNQE